MNHRIWISALLLMLSSLAMSRETPVEITRVVDAFLAQQRTSIDILQTINWRFYHKVDSLQVHMDILDREHFRLLLPGFRMEVYVLGDSLVTVNHSRAQILLESAKQSELLDQLFIGGDISDARLVKSVEQESGTTRDEFRFRSDYAEWRSLAIIHRDAIPQQIELIDYDGNLYRIQLSYSRDYRSFDLTLPRRNPWGYELADLRKTP